MEGDLNQNFAVYSWAEAEQSERHALGLAEGDRADALCLSGGGIRSAAFCLGVLQALDQKGLLKHFHYLSTVSGGGYVGGWLTRWLAERAKAEKRAQEQQPDFPKLDSLRRFTNFLTPQPGPFSLDTWHAILLWIRNTLINWVGLMPLLVLTVCLPMLYLSVACMLVTSDMIRLCVGVGALLALGWSVYKSCIDLPSHKHPDGDPADFDAKDYGPDAATMTRRVVVFYVLWTLAAVLAETTVPDSLTAAAPLEAFCRVKDSFSEFLRSGTSPACDATQGPLVLPGWPALWLPLSSVLVSIAAYLAAWHHVVGKPHYAIMENLVRQKASFSRNFVPWTFSAIISAMLLVLGEWLGAGLPVTWFVVLGPLWVVGSDILRSTVYVGVRHEGVRSDLDLEWLARLSASKLRLALAVACVAAAVLLAPSLLPDDDSPWRSIVALFGFATGPVTAKIASTASMAFQPDRSKAGKSSWLRPDLLVATAAVFFMIVLLTIAGRMIFVLDRVVAEQLGGGEVQFPAFTAIVLATMVASALLLLVVNRIKINRFSLHAMYRNRIVRAFLGTARLSSLRRPDRFTGFDPLDNLRLTDCAASGRPTRLLPVINVTLNMTSSRDMIIADRKAESFTMTPLHCGSGALSPPSCEAEFPPRRSGAYVPTCFYAGGEERNTGPGDKMLGISLGTALAVSGAAVSPNMGYYSSPLAAFLMTLFNFRLGVWLPNPAMRNPDRAKMKRSSPRDAIFAAFGDLFGQSNDLRESVYLSDGGHFDNLGLYEMLRRRCGRIIVVDAGADPDFACADFGRVLAYAGMDLGVRIEFTPPLEIPGEAVWQTVRRGQISYGGSARTGELLYIKPCLTKDAPAQIRAFKAGHGSFPHVSTIDQFFTGLVFESYRALGEFQAWKSFDASPLWTIRAGLVSGLGAVFRRAASASRTGSPRSPAS